MAGAVPDSSKVNGNAPTISTVLCIALAVCILVLICVIRKTNTLIALREVTTRTRSAFRGRGLDNETINSIPIIRFAARRSTNSEELELSNNALHGRSRPPDGRLETILEDGRSGLHEEGDDSKRNIRTHIIAVVRHWKSLVPKRPTRRLRNPELEPPHQDPSCPICVSEQDK